MNEIHVASLSINGAREYKKRKLYELRKQEHNNVAMLQKTHNDASDWVKE